MLGDCLRRGEDEIGNFHQYLYTSIIQMLNMFKNKAQGLSITTIVSAVIGLIIIVVLIALLTGKLGSFSEGLEKTVTCDSTCDTLGYDTFESTHNLAACQSKEVADPLKWKYVHGSYSDVPIAGKVCCCKNT